MIVALALVWWSNRKAQRRRPLLSLTFDPETGTVNERVNHTEQRMLMDGGSGTATEQTVLLGQAPAAHLRLEVRNAPRRDAAEHDEALLARIEDRTPGRQPRKVEVSFPPFG